jgi:hypothetical protein
MFVIRHVTGLLGTLELCTGIKLEVSTFSTFIVLSHVDIIKMHLKDKVYKVVDFIHLSRWRVLLKLGVLQQAENSFYSRRTITLSKVTDCS